MSSIAPPFPAQQQRVEGAAPSAPAAYRVLLAFFLGVIGIVLALMLVNGAYLHERASILASLLVTFVALVSIRTSRNSWLSRFFILLLVMPYSATIGHLFVDDYVWWFSDVANALIATPEVERTLLMAGLIGICGLAAGMLLVTRRPIQPRRHCGPTLTGPIFLLLLVFAVGLSYLSAPPETIFTAEYATAATRSIAEKVNFNGSFMLSYIVVILLYLDTEKRKASGRSYKLRMWSVFAGAAYIVVWLQLLRGDRECSGLVVALAGLHLTSPDFSLRPALRRVVQSRRARRLFALLSILAVVFLLTGFLRSMLSPGTRGQLETLGQQLSVAGRMNTWTGVLLTNLGAANDFAKGMTYFYGKTYLDYALSLPPGVITHSLGWERPIEPNKGPAWWYADITGGGLHILVVPWKNFGPFGILFVMMLIGWLIGLVDRANERATMPVRFMYGALFAGSLLWFWYGDMNLIRAAMAAALVAVLYVAAVFIPGLFAGRRRPRRPARRYRTA
jgi:hypothetical protein